MMPAPPGHLNPSARSLSPPPASPPRSSSIAPSQGPAALLMLDMDRFQRGGARSLRREKYPHRTPGSSKVVVPDLRPRGCVVGGLLLQSDGARGGGNVQMRMQASASKVEPDGRVKILTQHNMEGSSKKASGTPVKILMEKEMQNHVESRRHSPSVIAKLMGLDPLPAQQPQNLQKMSAKGSSESFPEKCISCKERKQEFKDIFEVLETRAVEKPSRLAVNGFQNSRRRDKEMATKRRKFMDAKHFSTDDKLQNSQETSEASEVLGSSKDPSVKFLEEPTSLFEKYLRDLHSVPATPEACHITILKSSNVSKQEKSEICQRSERMTERITPMRRNVMHKSQADIFLPSGKEHTASHSRKLCKSKLDGNIEVSSLPTRIVVLKPSLDKGQRSARVRGSSEDFQLDNLHHRRRREHRRSGGLGPFSDLRERQELADDIKVIHRMKGSREIAKEITEHMRHTVGSDSVRSYGARHSIFTGNDNLHRMPGDSACTDSDSVRQSSGHVDGWYKSHSSSYLTETYASREARKHLSERWMMTHKFQGVGLADHGMSTLGEMLALADRETPDMHSGPLSCQERLHVRLCGKEAHARLISPSGISSRDGWRDGRSSSLPRSKSLPASSTIYGSSNSADIHGTNLTDNPSMLKDILNLGSVKFSVDKSFNQRCVSPLGDVKGRSSTSQSSSCDEEENKLPVREIHVDQDKLLNALDSKNSSTEKFVHSESSACSISDTTYLVDCMPVACDMGPELPCFTAGQELAQSLGSCVPVADDCSPANYEKAIMEKEKIHNECEAGPSFSDTCATEQACSVIAKEVAQSSPISVLEPPDVEECSPEGFEKVSTDLQGQRRSVIAKEVDQPSPISVLEPPDENECSPESFEKVSADLQELRVQLELLKLESRDTYVDRFVVGNEDACGEIIDFRVGGGAPATFGDEEDRDFSYLLNVLTDSGFHNADWGALFSAFYSPESPVCPDVFEKLEESFGRVRWSRTERKLLFDVVNSVLADILALNMDQHPWAKPRRKELIGCRTNLADEVWQLVKQRTMVIGDVSGKFMDDIRWMDLANDIDSIGRQVENMLKDDLLEELISDIVPM